jgi:hypothetical protein
MLETPLIGGNERCVEIPYGIRVAAIHTDGWVLDAGCALNGSLPSGGLAHVIHLTQNVASERHQSGENGLRSYMSGDLRDLCVFRTGAFDRTVCISTLEHVGLDNESYHGPVESDPASVVAAVQELLRVTARELLMTVPFGWNAERFPQWRFIGLDEIGDWIRLAQMSGFSTEVSYYGRQQDRWTGGTDAPLDIPDGSIGGVTQVAVLHGLRRR